MRYVALGSLIAFTASITVLGYVDNRNDHDVLHAQCEATARAVDVTRNALLYLADEVPGDSQAEINFVAYIEQCLPKWDCGQSITGPSLPERCSRRTSPGPLTTDG